MIAMPSPGYVSGTNPDASTIPSPVAELEASDVRGHRLSPDRRDNLAEVNELLHEGLKTAQSPRGRS